MPSLAFSGRVGLAPLMGGNSPGAGTKRTVLAERDRLRESRTASLTLVSHGMIFSYRR